ncbi:sigma factor-like helix-turn-helix DNA-binding protein, partial [Arcobacter sp.]|uniref:sigma factor-like helix-turn-helix DNA-binding protein n=1 Tax=Arcobacter sp. TaxID=1872629 RepID=UPI003D14DE5A
SSLDSVIGDDSTTKMSDVMENETNDGKADYSINTSDLNVSINMVLNKLTFRERYIIENFYGVLGHTPRTLEEIGKELSVTRERVRQIESSAIKKLKHPKVGKNLKNYVES